MPETAHELKESAKHVAANSAEIRESAEQVEASTAKVEASADHMKANTAQMKSAAERATELAADRTVFAAERTYAAWVRTGLAALASGIGAKKLLTGVVPDWMVIITGTLLVLFSAFCFGAAVWRQMFSIGGPEADAPRIAPALLVIVNGFLALVALAALVSIWVGRGSGV